MPTDPLDPILENAEVKEARIERAGLEAICRSVSTVPAEEFIEACTRAPGLTWDDGQNRPDGYFEIHSRRWWIDVSDVGNRRYLLAVTVAAVLVDVLNLNFSTSWVAQVLPTLLAVRSVSRGDTGLRLDLARRTGSPLPPPLTETVNPGDYAEFAVAVEDAPAVAPICVGGIVTFIDR